MTKRIKLGLAAAGLAGVMMLAGCADADPFENPAQTEGRSETITETVWLDLQEPAPMQTVPAQMQAGSWLEELEPGDLVWCLHHATQADPALVRSYRYLARSEGYIIVSGDYPELYPDAGELIDAMLEQTAEGWCNMYLFPDSDCFDDKTAAWDAARAENGGT